MLVRNFEGLNIKDTMKQVKAEFGKDAIILGTSTGLLDDGKTPVVRVKAAAQMAARETEQDTSEDNHKVFELCQKIYSQNAQMLGQYTAKSDLDAIFHGLKEIKFLLATSFSTKKYSANPTLSKILGCLETAGISSGVIAEMSKALDFSNDEKWKGSEEELRTKIITWMYKKIRILSSQKDQGSPDVHFFVGTPGSGKTTLVAKVASECQKSAKPLVISFDLKNSNIGKNDHLRTLCHLLGADFRAEDNLNSLRKALKDTRYKKILVDVESFPQKEQKAIEELGDMYKNQILAKVHLVIPLTDKAWEIEKSIRRHAPLGLTSFAFTKIDLADQFGDIFNGSFLWSMPLSYFSTGPRIPLDFEVPTRERVIGNIFGL